jgi:GT2 family glycosyltransferase
VIGLIVISVLIYSEHDPAFLERCLKSLTPPPKLPSQLEVLVLDSGLSPERAKFAERLVAKLGEPFRWLPSKGETRRAALYNRAIKESRGDILVFTHDDAYFPDHWLALITAPLQDPAISCASGEDQVPLDERPFLLSLDYVLKSPLSSGGMRRDRGIRFGYFTPRDWNMAFSKRVLLEVGLFDPSVDECAESELILRIRKAGYKVAYVPESCVFHTRETTLRQITVTNFQRGFSRSRLALNTGVLRQITHLLAVLVLFLIPSSIIGSLFLPAFRFWLLIPAALYFGILLALGVHAFSIWKRASVLFWTPLLVISQHFGHGFGYLVGILVSPSIKEDAAAKSS